jgi:hypothetical protein
VAIVERPKKLHIKEMKVIEKKKKATKALAASLAKEEESDE